MILLSSDHAGFDLKEALKGELKKQKLKFVDLSPLREDNDDYPDVAKILAKNIKTSDYGIALCGTGQGVCIALNRFPNVRAVATTEVSILKLSRSHNDTNVLCLPGRFITASKAIELILTFLNTEFSKAPRHIRRLQKIS
ncbi:MAG: RpiB/LacA/LacB family sugar-phosphate isomerase [Patescibacteria group bacterium]